MASSCWVLFSILFVLLPKACLSAADPQPDATLVETDDKCENKVRDGQEHIAGYALLQRERVVHSRISGEQLPTPEVAPPELSQQQIAALLELRAMLPQGKATTDQLQKLFDLTAAALTENVTNDGAPPSVLLDTNTSQPFKGSIRPAWDRERFEKDYIRDGPDHGDDEPLFFPTQPPKAGQDVPNATLTYDPKEPHELTHVLAAYVVVPLASVFFFLFTASNVMESFEITAIPESGIMIAIGVVLGIFMKMYARFDFFNDPDAFAEMNSAILNLVLLPIIIFASGWSIRRLDFFSQFPYILLFAMAGVALSTVVIACLIFFTGAMHLHGVTRWRTAFAYASLISATDPVATLSTYAKLKVDPLLNIMVFGESIINDAVAIVLFGVFNSDEFMVNSNGDEMTGGGLLLSITWGILKIFCGSTLLGVGLGMLYTFVAHWADMVHNKKGQILVIFASCYLTYALAESCGLSGIIAEMFAALLMGVYMRPHLSAEGSLMATFFVNQFAVLADAAVCLLIGVSVVQLTTKGWYFGLWVMLFCLIGRSAAIFPVAFFVNFLKRMVGKANGVPAEGWNLLTPQHMFMMWHAGLRGAIALALALELGKWVDVGDGAGTRRALQTATFLVICTFLVVFGGSTSACLNHLKIPVGCENVAANHLSKTEDFGNARGFLKYLDKHILAPVLIGSVHNHAPDAGEQDVEDMLKDVMKW